MNALITGGAGGIGRSLVEIFLRAGYSVCFTVHENRRSVPDLAERGAVPIFCDLSTPEGCASAVSQAQGHMGNIDVLVNNAGVAQQLLFTDITDDDWRRMIDINLSAPFYLTRGVLPGMIHRKSGRIINIASVWGVVGASCEVHYSAAKAGLIGMTKALASEVAPSGITVNAIAPGLIDTPMTSAMGDETISLVVKDIPAGRSGRPEEIARAALFLASPESSYITGQVLVISGGMVIV